MDRVGMKALLIGALLAVSLLPGLEAASRRRPTKRPTKRPTPRRTSPPVRVQSGDLIFTYTGSSPGITVRSSAGSARGSLTLGKGTTIGQPLNTAVSPSGSVAAVLSTGASSGATFVTIVQLKPTLKLIGSAAVPGFGTYAKPAPPPTYFETPGYLLAVGDFSKSGQLTLFLDAVAPDTNCSRVYANTVIFDRTKLRISNFMSKTLISIFGTTCPEFVPPLPTLVTSTQLVGSSLSSLYIIQTLNSEDVVVQNVIANANKPGVLKPVFSTMDDGTSAIGNCFKYAVGDANNFFAACEVGSKLAVRLARFTNGKPSVSLTVGDLEQGGKLDTRFLATSPKSPTLYVKLARPPVKGKPQPDFVAGFAKSNGKLGRSFNLAPSIDIFAVVP